MSAQLLVPDDASFGVVAADAVLAALPGSHPRLGVATGGTPVPLYEELARRTRSGAVDLSTATLVALDEYLGVDGDDPRSYAAFVRMRIAQPLGVPMGDVVVPDGIAADPEGEAAAVERRIGEIGGIDVQIVGIGSNGHLAFNEPGSDFDSATRVVTLSDATRRDNARFFDGRVDKVPRRAITQGLGTIGRARAIVLVARGIGKAEALSAALRGQRTTEVPASVLQDHGAVTVVADHAAASLL
ncbi:glucosamine-6-phosphate deaminase [soil metagenome]